MEQVAINWFAVLGASLVGFVIGALWYGPLFGRAWMKSIGLDPEVVANTPKTGMARIMGITFVLQLLMAYCLAMFFGPTITTATGALYGFFAGFFWVAFAFVINGLFEQKSWHYMLINGGYWTVVFTLMGLILGTWPG